MSPIELYIRLGFSHITDLAGYDHMLFLLALVAGLGLRAWRRVIVLVSAFTLGHALTLALTALDIIHPRAHVVEFLIALTILLTALGNLILEPSSHALGKGSGAQARILWLRYGLAMGFGLIHGMGFSSYFRSLLGADASVVVPLLCFNIGIELGQLLVVGVILGVAWVVVEWLRLPSKWWRIGISVLAGGLAIWMMATRMG